MIESKTSFKKQKPEAEKRRGSDFLRTLTDSEAPKIREMDGGA